MDRIVVRTNADMQRVMDWSDELRGMAVELLFTEGEIEFEEELILLKFREETAGVVGFELYMGEERKKVCTWRSNLATDEIPELHIAGEGTRKMSLGLLLAQDNTVAKCVRKFRALMLFAAYYREEVERTRTVTRSVEPKPRKQKKGKNIRKMLTLRRYTVGSDMLSELPAPKHEWHGYAESFGVRGHYRHYKSGKVVWVRPYTKLGREEKKSDREYIL
jgi:hypothetical protein